MLNISLNRCETIGLHRLCTRHSLDLNSCRRRSLTVPSVSTAESLQLLLILRIAASTVDAVTYALVDILLRFLLLNILVLASARICLAVLFNGSPGGVGMLLVVAVASQINGRKRDNLLKQTIHVVLVGFGAGVSCKLGKARAVQLAMRMSASDSCVERCGQTYKAAISVGLDALEAHEEELDLLLGKAEDDLVSLVWRHCDRSFVVGNEQEELFFVGGARGNSGCLCLGKEQLLLVSPKYGIATSRPFG